MEERNTRELIMHEALVMFAAKGYAAVSMREIAATVGIRVSSIYHYFSGKQELFDALVQSANDAKNDLQVVFLNAFSKVETVEQEPFVQAGVFFLTGYLQNPKVELLLKVLECERLHNTAADEAWHKLFILNPLEHEKNMFRILKERGEIVEDSEDELAAEYQAAIMLAYFTRDVEQLQKQLRRFYQRVFKKDGIHEEERNM